MRPFSSFLCQELSFVSHIFFIIVQIKKYIYLCKLFIFQARYSLKYDHSKGALEMKMTDDVVCLQYKSDAAQDVKKMEKFVNNLMRHMASKEEH